jgi:hypothetical protein
MIMHVRLTRVLLIEVLVRRMAMTHRRMIVLVVVRRTEMLETPSFRVVIVGDMEVSMGVGERIMVVLLLAGFLLHSFLPF